MTQKRYLGLFFIAAAGAGSMAIAAESCSELNSRLVFNANGTVSDTKTGLTWSRCNVGQEWQGSQCTGNSAKYTFDETSANVKKVGQGYRLPTLTELMSIVAYDCGEPAVHKSWKAIESGFYWTSTDAFGGFKNTVLMTTGEEYPMNTDIDAWSLLVK
ncbi:MAG: DUF1566 domain-containing protein [Reinekea sp.]|nr:DUF1566 domain-containing protein [Reinekea sp.]